MCVYLFVFEMIDEMIHSQLMLYNCREAMIAYESLCDAYVCVRLVSFVTIVVI